MRRRKVDTGPPLPLCRAVLKGRPLRQTLALLLPMLATLAGCGDPGGPGGPGAVAGADPASGADAVQVAAGTVLPIGQIATVCDLAPAALGTAIGTVAGFTLYDTAPQTIVPRTHYITGLSDGCARQFSAALALLGDLPTHELIRYQPTNADLPWTATDLAYEAVKNDFCGVAQGQPCGARIDRLARQLAFITVYETFGTNPAWNEILLHGGDVLAMSFKSS